MFRNYSQRYIRILLAIAILLSASNPVFAQTPTEVTEAKKLARSFSIAFEEVASGVTPALVSITSFKKAPDFSKGLPPELDRFKQFFGEELFRQFFEQQQQQQRQRPRGGLVPQGLGTGFIIDQQGYILTNQHVVDDADQIKVKLNDRREFVAKLIGSDPKTDIALIKIDADHLKPVPLGDSDALKIGEWVVAAGNPFGLENTITAGIVSAKGRFVSAEKYENFIQTDAAINVGNSGGPLLNLDGQVIGINTMIISNSGASQGVGFAIPINMVQAVVKQLRENGKVVRGWLGIAIQDLNSELRESFDFKGEGVLVGDITEDSPAGKAGIEPGDIILSFAGKPVSSVNELRNRVADEKPGARMAVEVLRESVTRSFTVVLGEQPESTDFFNLQAKPKAPKTQPDNLDLGLRLQELNSGNRRSWQANSEGKVMVAEVEQLSPAAAAGIQPGDIILRVQGDSVDSVEQFFNLLEKHKSKKILRFVVESEGSRRFVIVNLGKE